MAVASRTSPARGPVSPAFWPTPGFPCLFLLLGMTRCSLPTAALTLPPHALALMPLSSLPALLALRFVRRIRPSIPPSTLTGRSLTFAPVLSVGQRELSRPCSIASGAQDEPDL